MWQSLFTQPLANALVFLASIFGSLGWAIIVLTILVRLFLVPLILPTLRSGQKMKELAPALEKLKKKYGKDKEKLAKAQMELYKKEGINPVMGCLPNIVQIVILIALFQVFTKALNPEMQESLIALLYQGVSVPPQGINLSFWYLNLAKPDLVGKIPGFFLISSAVFQFLTAKLSFPQAQAAQKEAQKTPQKSDDMAAMMQKQMVYMMPVMTIFIGLTLPSGVTLYWFVFSLTGLAQQYLINTKAKAHLASKQVKNNK